MSGPVPSNLVLLSDLQNYASASQKVRFLGCVDEYVVKTATLRLEHHYPLSSPPKVAEVNIEHVLETVKREEIDVGSWINVIGYLKNRKDKGIFVQAIMIWDAGNVDLEAYQKAIEARKEVS